MKCSIIAIFSILCNVLLTQGQVNEEINTNVSKAITFDSILEDINNYYKQNVEPQPQFTNPNVKAQLITNSAEADNNDENNGDNNNNNNNSENTVREDNGDNNNNGDNNSNGNNNDNSNNDNGNNNNDDNGNNGGDEEDINEGGCGYDRASLGMFAFHKPIKRSILVINSNFTIIWSYNNILEGYEYNFPKNDVTFKLYYEDDANPNNWANAWKSPVFERTVPLDQVEPGPVINGIQTYQYNWLIIPTTESGFRQTPKPNQKYKLRIYGDGKDVQSNSANFQCYGDGDIQPGLTVAFYLVDSTKILEKYYIPIKIEDGSSARTNISLFMTFMISILVILYQNW